MDNLMITGSMCFTDLVEQAKKGHSAFSKSEKNGKIYFNYVEWVNPNETESWKQASFQLNSTKDKREEELKANDGKKIYFGNGKLSEKSGGNSAPVQSSDVADLDLNALPF